MLGDVSLIVMLHLRMQEKSIRISKTAKGLLRNLLNINQIVFDVDRSQGGPRVTRVTHSPPVHHPERKHKVFTK